MASFHPENHNILHENKNPVTLASFLSPSLSHHLSASQTVQSDHEITSSSCTREPNVPREVKWETNSVFLTWQDLWVTVSAAKNGTRPILQGLTGYAQPGELLAIMGPSGCGKTTLLSALAGRLDSSTSQSGQILVNGRKQRLAFGTAAYVTQDDTLITTLTVRETIYYSALLQLPYSMANSEKRKIADTTIKEMGLQDVINTRIGGWSDKGISGGQKRRVSICIEILTGSKLLFLDEPTSGLDSAASYHVMRRILNLAIQDGRTIVASIHQPGTRVFELFHNLCLLSSGKTVYFGPSHTANEFFSLNGFPCPTMKNPSEHYLRTINTDFDQDFEQDFGKTISTEEAINTLVTSYKSFETHHKVGERIVELHKMEEGLPPKGIQASIMTQTLVLTRRSFLNMNRNLGYYWLRFGICIILSLCLGSIFYNIGHSYHSIRARAMMLMFVATLLTFMAIGGFPSFVEDMKIFGRERSNGHYRVAAFVLANTISSIPFLLLKSVVPGAIAYFLVGLQRGINHFVYYVLTLFACAMLVESLMMVVASIVPNFLMGIIVGAGIQGAMTMDAGCFRLPKDIPSPIWKYPLFYISFHRYAIEGLYKNEYEGLYFPSQIGGPPTTGYNIMKGAWQLQMGYSKWVDLSILFGMVVLYRLMFFVILTTMEILKPIIRSHLSASIKQRNTILVAPSSTPIHARGEP